MVKNKFINLAVDIGTFFRIDRILSLVKGYNARVKVERINNQINGTLKFVPQGDYDFEIMGPLHKFSIDQTSHIKSGTYIECSGGVKIGKFFHPGRGLTIFSSNHNWRSTEYLPYYGPDLLKEVVIGNAVWLGANVTILPGVKIGDGAIVAAGSVVTKNVPAGKVYGGNPAKEVAQRDETTFVTLLNSKKMV